MSTAMRALYYENTSRLGKCYFGVIESTSLRPQVVRGIARLQTKLAG
jgi:hypothetical protein